ncbi:MAG: hypothetical protein JWM26_694 [Betaproteobacteria bacterium]|jgi:hypothetical protein|nr:hypothetical protein [Betaproteobacteria bacterium]
MSKRYLPAVLLFTAASHCAHAEIYECVDQSGNKRFTNIAAEAKGCRVLNVGPVAPPTPTAPAAAAPATAGKASPARPSATPTPANFPRVDAQTQNSRDNDRRRILENELGNEQKLLDQARKELAAQEATRLGDERNYQRLLDRLEPFKKKVKLHEDNVANLRREMANMR